ncbi:MAG: carbohydrate ABC transporter permease [bacterium]
MKIIGHTATYVILAVVGIAMTLPFLWMLATSLMHASKVFAQSGFFEQLIPSPIVWSNYISAWKALPFGRFVLNTVLIVAFVTAGQIITSSLAAYSFARLNFPLRDKLFFGYLATMMIPGAVTMIPVFILISWLGRISDAEIYICNQYFGKVIGVDSYFALIVPGMFSAYGTFMLRQFFMGLPVELEEAAKIDGASLFKIYYRICLPLSKAALATLTTFVFLGVWKDFLWPLIITNSEQMRTVMVGLSTFQGMHGTDWPLLMAGSVMMLIPIIVIFLFNQRYYVEGIKLSGLSGI